MSAIDVQWAVFVSTTTGIARTGADKLCGRIRRTVRILASPPAELPGHRMKSYYPVLWKTNEVTENFLLRRKGNNNSFKEYVAVRCRDRCKFMSQCVFFAHSTVLHHGIGQSENKEHLSKGFHTALRTSTTRNRRLTMKSFFYYILKNVKSELWYKVSLWKITCGTHQTYITLVQSRITFINRNGNPADFIWNHPQMPLSFEKCL